MNPFLSALWAEALKARRSKMIVLTALGFTLIPLMDGLMMIVLKDPARARELGLIGAKAQLAAGVADWPTFLGVLLQGAALGGAILCAFITAWVFGREYADHTLKELLALPTPRSTIVSAKFVLIAFWIVALTAMMFVMGLGIGTAIGIPGGSVQLIAATFVPLLLIAVLTFMLMPFVALFASVGRGYLPAMGWAVLSIVLAQIIAVLGRGDWFPWAVPALMSGMAGPRNELLGWHSYVLVVIAFLCGLAATLHWWHSADQTR